MTKGIELPNQEKIRMVWKKKLQVLENIGSRHHQTSVMKEKIKEYLRRTRKPSKLNYIAETSS